jgi:hypothetical protein
MSLTKEFFAMFWDSHGAKSTSKAMKMKINMLQLPIMTLTGVHAKVRTLIGTYKVSILK